ncbi:MAG TPA: hypothetical protein VK911_17750 [Vicinamibacterales bacterium]|nr:hypothetical protein [Vicinamibacterales bacterium]
MKDLRWDDAGVGSLRRLARGCDLVHCLAVALVLGCGIPGVASAQPLPVAVTHSGSDELGRSFVEHIREALTYSGRYSLARSESEAELTLRVSTLDPSPESPGSQSFAGWSLLVTKRNDGYLSGGVRSFGAGRVRDSAHGLAVAVDAAASRHREEIPGSSEAKEAARSWDAAVQAAAQGMRSSARRKLFLQHMELQRTVFQLSGFLLPRDANLAELVGSVAAEYDDSEAASLAEDLAACRRDLAALKKAAGGPPKPLPVNK